MLIINLTETRLSLARQKTSTIPFFSSDSELYSHFTDCVLKGKYDSVHPQSLTVTFICLLLGNKYVLYPGPGN